jgi:4-amino-4-deoxy-L-arabinose transferase-like glycosyltransferase
MAPVLSELRRFGKTIGSDTIVARSWVRGTILALIFLLCIAKFFYLDADFPNESPWLVDQSKFTDEGWWANGAVNHFLTGHWYVAGDYNPAVDLPVWPLLLAALFHFTGVSVVAVRALNVAISVGTVGLTYLLLRRFTQSKATPLVAALLMAANPFAFVFGRLAILDTLVVFEFCLLLFLASFSAPRRYWILVGLALMATLTLLTKTTSLVLAPAIVWVAWSGMSRKWGALAQVVAAVLLIPAALMEGYALIVDGLGYGADYRYFFDVNAMPDLDWHQTLATLATLLQNGFWVDRVLYPLSLVILVATALWQRKFWSNPLFSAAWIALGAQSVFIFSRQDDAAPRYFTGMLAPMVWIVALTLGELSQHVRKATVLLLLVIAASVVSNVAMIRHFLADRDYDLRDAAAGIKAIVRENPEQKPLILGVSANQISLMSGIPSHPGYGSEAGRLSTRLVLGVEPNCARKSGCSCLV